MTNQFLFGLLKRQDFKNVVTHSKDISTKSNNNLSDIYDSLKILKIEGQM